MKIFLIVLSILSVISAISIAYMVITAQPYPKELQDAEDDELLRKFKEYRDNRSQD